MRPSALRPSASSPPNASACRRQARSWRRIGTELRGRRARAVTARPDSPQALRGPASRDAGPPHRDRSPSRRRKAVAASALDLLRRHRKAALLQRPGQGRRERCGPASRCRLSSFGQAGKPPSRRSSAPRAVRACSVLEPAHRSAHSLWSWAALDLCFWGIVDLRMMRAKRCLRRYRRGPRQGWADTAMLDFAAQSNRFRADCSASTHARRRHGRDLLVAILFRV